MKHRMLWKIKHHRLNLKWMKHTYDFIIIRQTIKFKGMEVQEYMMTFTDTVSVCMSVGSSP